jgi:glycosyltransferase involved in cell wall biosynthesis
MNTVLFMHKGGKLIRGSEISLLLLLENIDRSKINPIVLCNREQFADKVKQLGIKSIVMDWPEVTIDSPVVIQPLKFFKAFLFTKKIIRDEKVNVLYSNGGLPCQLGVILSKISKIKTICHIRSPHPRRYAWMWLFKFADNIIFVSDEVRKSMAEKVHFGNRTCVIYNAVDTRKFKKRRKNNHIRRKLSIHNDEVVIGQVGSLIPRKGIDVLLRAFAEIKRDYKKTKLVLVGEGDQDCRRSLERLASELNIRDDVIFTGETAHPELYYSEVFDINVLSSRMEALPRTLIEASACGLPSVASNSDGIPEVVENGVTGLLFEKENHQDLKEKLALLIDNKALRQLLGEKGRERVARMFTVESYVTKVQEEILNTIPTGKRRVIPARSALLRFSHAWPWPGKA